MQTVRDPHFSECFDNVTPWPIGGEFKENAHHSGGAGTVLLLHDPLYGWIMEIV